VWSSFGGRCEEASKIGDALSVTDRLLFDPLNDQTRSSNRLHKEISHMTPMQGETVLVKVAGNRLVLSTHRVRYETEDMGNAVLKSIMLEELASVAMVRTSNVVLLILAGISLVLGVAISAGNQAQEPFVIGAVAAAIFAVLFFASRSQVLSLASAGTTITVSMQGMKPDDVKEFIERTEAAKNARYLIGRSFA
jgi:hypothetical protein